MALIDSFGRTIDYLRISITDHCNLNCCYCMPVFSGRPHLNHIEILTYKELYRLAMNGSDERAVYYRALTDRLKDQFTGAHGWRDALSCGS